MLEEGRIVYNGKFEKNKIEEFFPKNFKENEKNDKTQVNNVENNIEEITELNHSQEALIFNSMHKPDFVKPQKIEKMKESGRIQFKTIKAFWLGLYHIYGIAPLFLFTMIGYSCFMLDSTTKSSYVSKFDKNSKTENTHQILKIIFFDCTAFLFMHISSLLLKILGTLFSRVL